MVCNYFLLPFFLIAFVLNNAFVLGQGQTKQQLIDLAIELGAPFAKTALERLHGSIFGSGRAARSTDCIIINKSKHNFKLAGNSCSHGIYTNDFLPELNIKSKTSSVFGVESHGFMTGVECTTKYESTNASNASFEVTTNNPYVGTADGNEVFSQSLKVFRTTGGGNNNQIRWVVEDINKPTPKPTTKKPKTPKPN